MLNIKNNIGSLPEGTYVWKKYTPAYTEQSSALVYGEEYHRDNEFTESSTLTWYYSLSYTFDKNTGKFTLDNPSTTTTSSTSGPISLEKRYVIIGSPIGSVMYYSDYRLDFRHYYTLGETYISLYSSSDKADIYTSIANSGKGDFISYVVADSPTTYPDGGVQSGYWYEKFQLDPTLFGCTKYAVDKFTLSSLTNVYNGYTVNHSLGEVPKVIFLSTPEEITYGYRCIRRYIQFPVSAGLAYAVVTNNTAGGDDKYGAKVDDYGTPFNAPTNSQVTITEQLSRYEYLQSGIEYTLITMA